MHLRPTACVCARTRARVCVRLGSSVHSFCHSGSLVLSDAHRERQIHSEKQIVPCCECEVAKERKQKQWGRQTDSEAAGRGAAGESKAGTKSVSSVIHLSSVSKSAPDPGLHPFCLFHLTDVPLTGRGGFKVALSQTE